MTTGLWRATAPRRGASLLRAGIYMGAITTALTLVAVQEAAAECTGVFRQCANAVGATCTKGANGGMTISYYDRGGSAMIFEQCVGKVFEAHGRPNPYKPAGQSAPKNKPKG